MSQVLPKVVYLVLSSELAASDGVTQNQIPQGIGRTFPGSLPQNCHWFRIGAIRIHRIAIWCGHLLPARELSDVTKPQAQPISLLEVKSSLEAKA